MCESNEFLDDYDPDFDGKNPENISEDFGKCPTCGKKLIPLDGGNETYCPNGHQLF
jgi:hypothetical protein